MTDSQKKSEKHTIREAFKNISKVALFIGAVILGAEILSD